MKTVKMAAIAVLVLCMGSARLEGGVKTITFPGGPIPDQSAGAFHQYVTVTDAPANAVAISFTLNIVVVGDPFLCCKDYTIMVSSDYCMYHVHDGGGPATCNDGGLDDDPEDDYDIELHRKSEIPFASEIVNQPWGVSIYKNYGGAIAQATQVSLDIEYVEGVDVPNVVGMTQWEAEQAITGLGLQVLWSWRTSSSCGPSGLVRRQYPAAGSPAVPGSSIEPELCTGPYELVPYVVEMTQRPAECQLQERGLTLETSTLACSDTLPAGWVIGQSPPAGTTITPGMTGHLTVSSGPCSVAVPNVVGMSLEDAQQAIFNVGCNVAINYAGGSQGSGQVIAQDPPAGSLVAPGTTVQLTVSSNSPGPAQVQVPNVMGMMQAVAQSAITSVGLVVGTVEQASSDTVAKGSVISQNPAGGTSVEKGSAVNLVVSSGPPDKPQVVRHTIWVSDGRKTVARATAPDDRGWVDLLRSVGYEVDYQPPVGVTIGYWQTLDTAKLAALDAADLIIVSRDTNSSAYCTDATEITQWNSIKTPLILLNAYIAPSNQWLWINSTDMGARQAYYTAQAVDPLHPVFDGVTLDGNGQVIWLDRTVSPGFSSCVNTTNAGNGHIIAARPDNNYVLIAEWAAGIPFYSGSTQTPGDRRMFFSAGTQETTGTPSGYGVYDLTAEGETMFLNAVAYMMNEANEPPAVDDSPVGWWKLDETSGDVVFDSAAENDGVAYGAPVWQPTGGKFDGSLRLDGVNDYVQLPIGSMIGSLTDSTFAAWVNWTGTTVWQRIFDFGSGQTVNMFLTPRNGHTNSVRFGITNAGNTAEDRATAAQALATGWHHVAVTINAVNKANTLYVDGQVAATTTATRYTPSSLGNTTQNWLGRSQYSVNPYFVGSLDDFCIYNRVLSPAEVAELATP